MNATDINGNMPFIDVAVGEDAQSMQLLLQPCAKRHVASHRGSRSRWWRATIAMRSCSCSVQKSTTRLESCLVRLER